MSDSKKPNLHIDRQIHQPARLQIIAHLFVVEEADMTFLKRHTGLTWGNLSSHIAKLEEVGYVSIKKEIRAKKPHTTLKLSKQGRTAFETYRQNIQALLYSNNRS